jgi:NitT/TauT family transport system substrate-binding protein
MWGQVDVGWSAPPFGLEAIDQGKIRVIASGNDAAAFKGQTVRVNITSEPVLAKRKDAIDRYMAAYRETVDWMYADPAALKEYADFVGISAEIARRTRDEFFPKEALDPDKVVGLDTIVADAVELKYTAKPLTQEQIAGLLRIPPRQ